MKATGIVRKLDQLGHIVIPKELRDAFNWKEGTPVEFFIEGENIICREYKPCCIFCGDSDCTILYDGKQICSSCFDMIRRL